MLKSADKRDIGSYLGKLGQLRFKLRAPITGWTATPGRYNMPGKTDIFPEQSIPIQVGEAWWAETLYFEASALVPEDFAGQTVYLDFLCDGECLLYVDGIPAQGLDLNHNLHLLGETAGKTLLLRIEAANRWQNYAHAVQNGTDYPAQVFRKADLVALDADIDQLYYILYCLYETESDFAIEWLLKARRLVHPDASPDEFRAATKALLAELLPELERTSAAKNSRIILAAGHSHLDLGYLWPVKETVRKLGRTFANMLYLLDQYPEFYFSQSQAILFEWAKQYYPELYERVKAYIKSGRFEIVGGMYVEADANMVSGEASIRQFLYGQTFFMEEFSYMPTVGWLPDTFGLSAILPQIMIKCGLTSFYSAKLRANVHYSFPHTLYQWEGLDGSQITANLSPYGTYNGAMTCAEIIEGEKNDAQKSSENNTQLYSVGFGDGGGGVTRDMIERARVYDKIPLLPHVKWAKADEYFGGVLQKEFDLPIWRGEKYFDLHQGTLTSQAALKRGNRKGEAALLAAEILDVMAGGLQAGELRELWKTLLLNQFHDILPGSCQKCVADVAKDELDQLVLRTVELQKQSVDKIANEKQDDRVTIFNTLSFARSGYVEIDGEWLYADQVPAMGFKIFKANEMHRKGHPSATETCESIILENDFIRAIIDKKTAELTSLFEKQTNRDALKGIGNRFLLYDEIYEFYDAWNIHHETLRHPLLLNTPCKIEITENSDTRIVIRLERALSEKSSIEQDIILTAMNRRLEFNTKVNWHETGRMLKVLFDVDVYAPEAHYDLSYGNIARSTGNNTDYEASQIEVCAHKWADLSDAGFGVALLNDCKYGYRIKGSGMTLTLLKSPKYPDTEADMGAHTFTYAIYPHEGDFRKGEVDREGYDLNQPLITAPGAGMNIKEMSYLSIEGKGIYADALKSAHDGSKDLILRLFENHGAKRQAKISLKTLSPLAVWECDMLEREQTELHTADDLINLTFTPYEIKTLRIKLSAKKNSR